MEAELLHKISKDIEFIKREIVEIREHMIDVDTILIEEEKRMVDESIEEEKKGKLVSLSEVKKRLGRDNNYCNR